MRKRSYSIDSEADEGLINLTPLIDVVFVVLIMFILIAPMLEQDRIALASHAEKSNKESSEIHESSPIVIHVHEDNSIWFNRKQIEITELARFLKAARTMNPHRTPQLFHDKKAYFGTYQSVKNAVEEAGFEQMDVILKPHD
jgi:biopolymer transport protein ExbD